MMIDEHDPFLAEAWTYEWVDYVPHREYKLERGAWKARPPDSDAAKGCPIYFWQPVFVPPSWNAFSRKVAQDTAHFQILMSVRDWLHQGRTYEEIYGLTRPQ